jgi:hypothetical protein
LNTPILLLVYKKPETTKKVVDAIRISKVKKIYISINIPHKKNIEDLEKHKKIIKIINMIDWNCKVIIKKRTRFINAYDSYSQAIKWFFKNEKEGIILEDDTLPSTSFFTFCEKLLKKYRKHRNIAQICGTSFINKKIYKGEPNYFFSNYSLCWGYATWRHSIKDYDYKMKDWENIKKNNIFFDILNNKKFVFYWTFIFDQLYSKKLKAWDYFWLYSNWKNKKISIIPKKHLVQNIGFTKDATHTKLKYRDWYNDLKPSTIKYFNNHPKKIITNVKYDLWVSQMIFKIDKFFQKKNMFYSSIRALITFFIFKTKK